jgi:RNA polymerase sigma-70 factor (ECF subfamily)
MQVEDEALRRLSGDDIRSALVELERREREAIELAFFGGMSYRAVAEHLGIPEGTVKSRIRSGLRRLQLRLVIPDTLVSS